jgi:hypothetical protein
MKIESGKLVRYVIISIIFLVAVGLAFYVGVEHEIAVQKSHCQCWDGVNNVCLPVTACE